MADFIKVSSREEAKQLTYQHYQDTGSLTGGNRYILPDGTKLRIRKRIPGVSGANDLKAEDFGTKARSDVGRSTRIGSSKKVVNRAIRDEAAAQWDELVGDRNATITIGGKPYSFDQYLNKEVRDHSKLTKQKAVEAVNLGKSLGHGTPTTDVGRYAESYTQQFAETPTGNYSTQDYIPPDQLERLQKAGLAASPQEAARLHVGTTKIGGRLPDVKIEELLKIKPSGNLTRASSQNRAALTAMAAGGIAALGPLGTAASAAETAGRTQIAQQTRDPADIAQAVIAGISSLGDVATYNPITAIPGEVVSTAADVANVVIDKARAPKPKPVQIDQLIPRPKAVMANTPTGVAQLKAMPKSKNIDLINEAQYFIVNRVRSAFDRVFGNRGI